MPPDVSVNGAAPAADAILTAAAARGAVQSLAYAGEVTPQEAFTLQQSHGAIIVDVRSHFEYQFIGRVPGSVLVPWKFWPSGESNPHFLAQLKQYCRPDDIVLLLCRSAARSHAAAILATEAGFSRVYNILEGFEGAINENFHRGDTGWRRAGLPWVQD